MKKLTAILLSLILCLSCCGAFAEDKPVIGIIQLMEHVALSAAREGFIQALADNGYTDGENIAIDYQNGQGESSNLSTIAERFVGENADLVLAIATPAALQIASKTETIPILGTAITDYVEARLAETNLEQQPGYGEDGYTLSAAGKIRAAGGHQQALAAAFVEDVFLLQLHFAYPFIVL